LEVLTFANLHYIHDYYQAAVAPLVSALVGVGGCLVWDRVRGRRLALPAAATTAALAVALPLVATRHYWRPTYDRQDPARVVQLVAAIDRYSRPNELVAVASPALGWNPQVFYYAHRRGQMMPVYVLTPALPDRLRAQGYHIFFSAEPDTDPLWTMRAWPYVGAVAPGVYRTSTSFSHAPAVAGPRASVRTGRAMLPHAVELRCGRTLSLTPPHRAVLLRLAPAPQDARLLVDPSPLPVRSNVLVRGARVTIGCAGTSAVRVLTANDVIAEH